jgi:hypothetical protein
MLTIYRIRLHGILIGIINKEPIIYKCITRNGIVTGIVEVDAVVVVTGIVACNGAVTGFVDTDAVVVAA